jgi:hypothetical protein
MRSPEALQLLATTCAHGDLASIRSHREPGGAGTAPLNATPVGGRELRFAVGIALQRHRTTPAAAETLGNPSHSRRDDQMSRAHIRDALEAERLGGRIVRAFGILWGICADRRLDPADAERVRSRPRIRPGRLSRR